MNKFVMVSSLEKIFLDQTEPKTEYTHATILKNEIFSYQIAYTFLSDDWRRKSDIDITLESSLDGCVSFREVRNVPSEYPCAVVEGDRDVLRSTPGLYPDLLVPLEKNHIESVKNVWHSLWITVRPDGRYHAGKYPITVRFTSENEITEKTFEIEIIDAYLPEQETIFTNWFHADCIASVYGVRVFSEKHWKLIEKYMRAAHDSGVNMILTPIFTPPLDTEVGGERPTVQLVGVSKNDENYSFDFSLFDRWISLADRCGMKYYEISHLFTQWGAKATPKVIASVDGRKKRIFGWDTPADSKEYTEFLDAFLPEFREHITKMGIAERCYFHISDEPSGEEQRESYLRAKGIVVRHLGGLKITDALSHIDFYKSGAVERPIPETNSIEPFLTEDISERWTYYCCGHIKSVSNQFFGMPSARNRVIGAQMYKYGIKGFLHWGFNFYYSALSREVIDPFATTDANSSFPSGDAFRVYPGKDGPLESIRLCVFRDALTDIRAMKLLEEYIGHDEVVKISEKKLGHIAFTMEPSGADQLLSLREEINKTI